LFLFASIGLCHHLVNEPIIWHSHSAEQIRHKHRWPKQILNKIISIFIVLRNSKVNWYLGFLTGIYNFWTWFQFLRQKYCFEKKWRVPFLNHNFVFLQRFQLSIFQEFFFTSLANFGYQPGWAPRSQVQSENRKISWRLLLKSSGFFSVPVFPGWPSLVSAERSIFE